MKIVGMGVDIEQVERFVGIVHSERRLLGIFCESEAAYIKGHKNRAQTACGLYCAKEALSKALGCGIRGFRLKEIEIAHDDLGKPCIVLHGAALKLWGDRGFSYMVSISHTREYATAAVIACGPDQAMEGLNKAGVLDSED